MLTCDDGDDNDDVVAVGTTLDDDVVTVDGISDDDVVVVGTTGATLSDDDDIVAEALPMVENGQRLIGLCMAEIATMWHVNGWSKKMFPRFMLWARERFPHQVGDMNHSTRFLNDFLPIERAFFSHILPRKKRGVNWILPVTPPSATTIFIFI